MISLKLSSANLSKDIPIFLKKLYIKNNQNRCKMKIDLKEYLEHRDRFLMESKEPGPVITISREFGCGATVITRKLIQSLNEFEHKSPWKYISKEIIYDSARELKLSPAEVKRFLHPHDRNVVEDLLSSLTINFQVEQKKIMKTIRDVIYAYANLGNVIILGQGGVAITKNIRQSLHVKIIGPLDWRASQLSEKMGISFNEARKRAVDHDHRRTLCIDHFMGRPTDYSIFDLILNASTLSVNEITNEILNMLEIRKMAKVPH